MEMKTTKHNFFSRGIAVLLSVLMCFGAFSMTAFATEDTSADTPQQQLENLLDKIYALNADDYTADSYNELKEQAEKVFAENGMTLEEATILFFEETVRLGRLPFELDDDLREYIAKQLDTPASDSVGSVRP